MFWSFFSDVTNLVAWFFNNASFLPENSSHLHCRLRAVWFMAASYQLYHVTISLVLRERVTLGILCLLLLKKWLRNYIFRVWAFIKTAQKDWERFLLLFFFRWLLVLCPAWIQSWGAKEKSVPRIWLWWDTCNDNAIFCLKKRLKNDVSMLRSHNIKRQ